MYFSSQISLYIHQLLFCEYFINRHKIRNCDFTRQRSLTFFHVFILILRKSVKSLQIVINELFLSKGLSMPVTASAYSQARQKLNYTAFEELSQGIANQFYQQPCEVINSWRGFRCLAFDATYVLLPDSEDIRHTFGVIENKQTKDKVHSTYCGMMVECCYDVLNHIVVSCAIDLNQAAERDLAIQIHEALPKTPMKDLCIYDRGYPSYGFCAYHIAKDKHFLLRCQRSSFIDVMDFFVAEEGETRKIVTLKVPDDQRKAHKDKGLPLEISVQLIRLRNAAGEVQVIMTSLLDETIPLEEFKALYRARWEIETHFGCVKNRLNLENFTGKTALSVLQDFWSTILVCNYEAILTREIEQEDRQDDASVCTTTQVICSPVDKGLSRSTSKRAKPKYSSRVNKAVSFNALKNMVFDLLFDPVNLPDKIKQLKQLLKMNKVSVRSHRNPERRKSKKDTLLKHHKYKLKKVF